MWFFDTRLYMGPLTRREKWVSKWAWRITNADHCESRRRNRSVVGSMFHGMTSLGHEGASARSAGLYWGGLWREGVRGFGRGDWLSSGMSPMAADSGTCMCTQRNRGSTDVDPQW